MNSVAVFGRGKSLENVLKFYNYAILDRLYLVNDMSKELPELPTPSIHTEVIHVAGRKTATIMEQYAYKIAHVNRVVINAIDRGHICNIKRHVNIPENVRVETRPECMMDRGYEPVGWGKILKNKSAAIKSDNGRAWPTTGLFAIDLALTENNPETIDLVGFDFYTKPYFIKRNRPSQTQSNPKIKMMYKHLQQLVYEYRGTEFICYSDIRMIGSNWRNV